MPKFIAQEKRCLSWRFASPCAKGRALSVLLCRFMLVIQQQYTVLGGFAASRFPLMPTGASAYRIFGRENVGEIFFSGCMLPVRGHEEYNPADEYLFLFIFGI